MRNSLNFAKLIKYLEGYDFGEFFNDGEVEHFLDYFYDTSIEYHLGEWECKYGATKLVILMKNEDIVFKIPFNSTWNSEIEDFSFFYGAPCASTWDYCEAEEDRYNQAEEEGFADYLAHTSYVYKTKNGIRIYIQPKCSTKAIKKTTSSKSHQVLEKWFKQMLPIDDVQWLNTFLDCYGAYKLKKFLTFLRENEWDDDLSTRNIGYTKMGMPVLVDYSSYMEQHIDFQSLDLSS